MENNYIQGWTDCLIAMAEGFDRELGASDRDIFCKAIFEEVSATIAEIIKELETR